MSDLERLRWLGIWLPVVGIGLFMGLVEAFILFVHLPHWPFHTAATLVSISVIGAGAYLFSHFIFRIVRQKEEEVLRRNRELAALNDVGAVINDSLDLEEILDRALDKVLQVTGAEAGEIFLWNDRTEELVLHAFRGLCPEAFQEVARFKLGEGFPGQIAQVGEAMVVHDLPGDARFLRGKVAAAGFQSFAGVPLRSKGKMVGVMGIATLDARRLTSGDVDLLGALGRQIGIALENSRLYTQLKDMTLLEERHRIAREMHDGLAQELGYLHLTLGELEGRVASQPASGLREELHRMKKVAAGAYEEVRQAIFGLKLTVSRGLGLVSTLAEYLHEFSAQSGIAIELRVADEQATRLSPHAEVQVIRIIQEALANVRKHAQARHAWVTFDAEGGRAKVIVHDDGRGFDPEETARLGRATFGLQSMRERAEAVGGMLRVESQQGKGTDVVVWLPLGGQEGASWRP